MIGRNRNGALVVLAWLMLCLVIAFVGVSTLRQIQRQAVDDAAEDAERVSRLLLAHFERTADAVDGFMTNFATAYSPQWAQGEMFRHSQTLYLPDAIVQLTLVDTAGQAFASSLTPNLDPVDVSDREHIRVHLDGKTEGLYISAPVLGRISGLPTIQFTRAIRNEVGQLQAIIVASYDLSDFTSFYEGLNLNDRGIVALVGLDGIVRVRTGADATYGQDVSSSPLFQDVKAQKEGRYQGPSFLTDIEQIGFFTTSLRYPFYTRVAFNLSYVQDKLRGLRQPIIASLLGLAFVLTLAMIGTLWALRREATAADRLHQTQRLKALGKLTGGIAHDFNNLLTIIMGNLDLLKRAPPERRTRHIDNAMMAAERGKSLTHQLLAFSRRQPLSPAIHDLNRLVVDMGGMLTHTLRSDISIELDLEQGIWPVAVDANQLQIALINLAVNARDAMPDGGVLKISTHNMESRDEVCLAMEDSGFGMQSAVIARAVEPFYTTKELGKGTGLGLAQVHGFVHQSGGSLKIASRPGEGTSVSLSFPRSKGAFDALPEKAPENALPSGLRVLVVDDNKDIAALAASVLDEQDCIVQQAHGASEALELLEKHQFDLLLTDVVMPGEMDGISLAEKAKAAFPDMPVILMTGYSERLQAGETVRGELILKPFSPRILAEAIQRVLPATGDAAAGTLQGELKLTE